MMGNEVTLTGTVVMTVRSEPLVQLIKSYTDGLRYVVHSILEDPSLYGRWRYIKRSRKIKWEQDISRISKAFYELLKHKFNLPPKIAQSCFREASMIAKSVINNQNNNENKCIIKEYRARFDNQSWKLEIRNDKCYLKLKYLGEIEVTGWNKKRLEKYINWSKGDLIMKTSKDRVKLFAVFKKTKEIADPSERAIAVDLNFNEIVVGNFDLEQRFKTPMQKIIHIKKNCIEKTQKRYPKQWLKIKGIRRTISRWWRRISGINDDFVKQVSKKVVEFAKVNDYDTIVLEDLSNLRLKQSDIKKKSWRERFTFFAYRKLQQWIEWQAKKDGLAVIYVPAKKTSKICPNCGSKLTREKRRIMKCENCGLALNRDSVAVRNLVNKWLGVLRCAV